MKVYISNYRDHWISPYTILEKVCFWEKDRDVFYNHEDKPDHKYEKWLKVLTPICGAIMRFLDFVHPKIDYVKIDRWDTWSMDHSLSHIILPMLKQLRNTKHGAPHTDDEDVPEYLRSHMAQPKEHEWDTDSLHFMRWDWILDEMIWAFEQKVDSESDNQFFDHSVSNGKLPWDKDYVGPKYFQEEHMAWQKRKENGFRLFGKYYQNLWRCY